MSRSNAILFFIGLFLSLNSSAQFKSGNELKSNLDDANSYVTGVGFGYIIGVADTIGALGYVCLPSGETGVRAGQIKDVVHKYLRTKPEILHKSAADLVYFSLKEIWPCKKASSGNSSIDQTPREKPQAKPKPIPKKEDTSPF